MKTQVIALLWSRKNKMLQSTLLRTPDRHCSQTLGLSVPFPQLYVQGREQLHFSSIEGLGCDAVHTGEVKPPTERPHLIHCQVLNKQRGYPLSGLT